jgi:demethylmenaquinone methyltransferase / 2-methoxy-6-polyprenyl-1,4-benzoquinol methylase
VSQQPASGAIKPDSAVAEMFGRIVRRYDLMNRLMTGGMDVRWRKKAVTAARGAGDERALDVATGTGDLAIALADGGFREVIGIDFAPEMIAAAEAKRHGRADLTFQVGDALHLPFPDDQFDAVTVSFGLRNMKDYQAAITEMTRVVKPGGRWICLELTPYRTPVLGTLFNWYFTRIVPTVGGWLSGDAEAYHYLPTSVASFPDAETLLTLMRSAGLAAVEYELLGMGTVALHVGIKPVEQSRSRAVEKTESL